MQITILAPQTAATVAPNHAEANLTDCDAGVLSADNLATTEEADIFVQAGGSWVLYTPSGSVVKLTATIPSIVLAAGARYGVLKDATAGACGLYLSALPHSP